MRLFPHLAVGLALLLNGLAALPTPTPGQSKDEPTTMLFCDTYTMEDKHVPVCFEVHPTDKPIEQWEVHIVPPPKEFLDYVKQAHQGTDL